jgi:hypothetical protein
VELIVRTAGDVCAGGHEHGWLFNKASRNDTPLSIAGCTPHSTPSAGDAVALGGSTSLCGNSSNWVLPKSGLVTHLASGLCLSVPPRESERALSGEESALAVLGECGSNSSIVQGMQLTNGTLRLEDGRCLDLLQLHDPPPPPPPPPPTVRPAAHASAVAPARQRGGAWSVQVGVRAVHTAGTTTTTVTTTDTVFLLPTDKTLQLRVFVDHSFCEVFWMGGRSAMTVALPSLSSSPPPLATTAAALARARAKGGSKVSAMLLASRGGAVTEAWAWAVESIWQSEEALRQQIQDEERRTTSTTRRGPELWT